VHHPRYRRIAWHPVVAFVPLWIFVNQLVRGGGGVIAWVGAILCGLWFVLTLVNRSNNRVLNWLYSKD
jgi:hypothetical protein